MTDTPTLLVIGANGFIGSHLVRHAATHRNVVTADVSPACPEGASAHHCLEAGRLDLEGLVAQVRPDVVVNCAGAANVSQSFEQPGTDFALNVALVRELLEAVRLAAPAARIVNLSSAAVYGNPASLPIREDMPLGPISPYGFHKQMAEILCREYAQLFGLRTVSLRPFSVFGPGLRKQLFWDIFQRAQSADVLRCPGTGDETRDFIFVEDTAQAILCAIDRADFAGEAINVANGQGITIREAVTSFLDAVGWQGRIEFTNEVREGDPLYWTADVTRLRALGYQAVHDFNSGVNELARWITTSR